MKKSVKIIKINLVRVIIGIIAFIIGLNLLEKLFFSAENVEVIQKKQDVSLDEFLSGYQNTLFTKIVLTNGTDLQGYIPVSGTTHSSMSLMSLQKNIEITTYDVLETKKPLDTSLVEMGISLTGSTIIDVEYKEESFLTSLFLNTVLPILLLVLLFTVGMRIFSGK